VSLSIELDARVTQNMAGTPAVRSNRSELAITMNEWMTGLLTVLGENVTHFCFFVVGVT
jgi:hypothetical protein